MKVAAIQAAPVFLQREATTEKVLQLMREAARQGTQLCVFPETFLPGYPVWLMHLVSSLSEAQRQEAYARYLEAAVDPNGPEMPYRTRRRDLAYSPTSASLNARRAVEPSTAASQPFTQTGAS